MTFYKPKDITISELIELVAVTVRTHFRTSPKGTIYKVHRHERNIAHRQLDLFKHDVKKPKQAKKAKKQLTWGKFSADYVKAMLDKGELYLAPHSLLRDEVFENNEPRIIEWAKDNHMDVDSYVKQVKQKFVGILKDARVFSRVPKEVIFKILTDGRFKSQFETGNSKGMFDPDSRKTAENFLFSYPESIYDTQRPIYGYIDDDLLGESSKYAKNYGEIIVEFKEEIKQRSTWTQYDSLGASLGTSALPQSFTDVDVYGLDLSEGRRYSPTDVAGLRDLQLGSRGYMEAQMHGSVTLADIKMIHIPDSMKSDPEDILNLTEILKREKIPYSMYSDPNPYPYY